MQVWPASGPDAHGAPQWPAATGEPVWSDAEETAGRPAEPGDVPVWPPSAIPSAIPSATPSVDPDGNTHDVRAAGLAVPGRQERPGQHERTATAGTPDPGAHAAGPVIGYAAAAPPDAGARTGDAASSSEPGTPVPGPVPPLEPEPLATPAASPGPGSPAPAEAGAGHVPGPGPSPQPGAAPTETVPTAYGLPPQPVPQSVPQSVPQPVPWTEPALGAQGPASQPDPMSGAQGPAPRPESVPQPQAQSPDPASHAQGPVSGAAHDLTARPVEPGAPPPLPEPGDQPTPPGGIPVISPSFSPSPVKPPASPDPAAPLTGEVVRGPFTPPSAVVRELPPAPTAPPPRRRGNTILIAAVVTLVVGGIGTGAFFAYQSFAAKRSASATDPIPTSEPVDPTEDPMGPAEPDPVKTEILNSERTDPGKMDVADAFAKKITVAGSTFVRVKTDVTQKCDEAAAGKFASTLTDQDCRRVLRATYVDSKKKYAVTTGIAVMPSLQAAVDVDRTKNLASNLWFRGLQGTPGSGAERVHIAGGYAAGLVWGRYIVFSYATFSDGHTPTAKEKNLGKVSGAFRDETTKVIERRVTG
ncbi:hypothetical protein [Streptosporangium sp. NPDC051022]|uniref:hypothetical protein n=1 Tax=Streptosporangium sp. NPDC051022 TaxID=3155752 RepID=UPI0034169BCF